jgi:hypothetical protein
VSGTAPGRMAGHRGFYDDCGRTGMHGLTPELSRAVKRRRLGRIVRHAAGKLQDRVAQSCV